MLRFHAEMQTAISVMNQYKKSHKVSFHQVLQHCETPLSPNAESILIKTSFLEDLHFKSWKLTKPRWTCTRVSAGAVLNKCWRLRHEPVAAPLWSAGTWRTAPPPWQLFGARWRPAPPCVAPPPWYLKDTIALSTGTPEGGHSLVLFLVTMLPNISCETCVILWTHDMVLDWMEVQYFLTMVDSADPPKTKDDEVGDAVHGSSVRTRSQETDVQHTHQRHNHAVEYLQHQYQTPQTLSLKDPACQWLNESWRLVTCCFVSFPHFFVDFSTSNRLCATTTQNLYTEQKNGWAFQRVLALPATCLV